MQDDKEKHQATKKEADKLKQELERYKQSAALVLKQETDKATAMHNRLRAVIDSKTDKIDAAADKYGALQKKLDECKKEAARVLTQEQGKAIAAQTRLRETIDSKTQELAKVLKESQRMAAETKKVNTQFDQLQAKFAAMQTAHDKALQENQELFELNDSLAHDIEAFEASLQEQLEAAEQSHTATQAKICRLISEKTLLVGEKEHDARLIKEQFATIIALQAKEKKKRACANDISGNNQPSDRRGSQADKRDDKPGFQIQINDDTYMKNAYAHAMSFASDLDGKVHVLEDENTALKKQINSLQSEIVDLAKAALYMEELLAIATMIASRAKSGQPTDVMQALSASIKARSVSAIANQVYGTGVKFGDDFQRNHALVEASFRDTSVLLEQMNALSCRETQCMFSTEQLFEWTRLITTRRGLDCYTGFLGKDLLLQDGNREHRFKAAGFDQMDAEVLDAIRRSFAHDASSSLV